VACRKGGILQLLAFFADYSFVGLEERKSPSMSENPERVCSDKLEILLDFLKASSRSDSTLGYSFSVHDHLIECRCTWKFHMWQEVLVSFRVDVFNTLRNRD